MPARCSMSEFDPRDGRLGWFGGCEACRARWSGPPLDILGEPRDLGESLSAQAHLFKCGLCHAYWVGDADHPFTITREQALAHLPDLTARERAADL